MCFRGFTIRNLFGILSVVGGHLHQVGYRAEISSLSTNMANKEDNGKIMKKEVESTQKPLADFSRSNAIKYMLRRDQTRSQISSYKGDDIRICAPSWVQEALTQLHQHTGHIEQLEIIGKPGSNFDEPDPPALYDLPNEPSLIRLQLLSRNEAYNVDGIINIQLYDPALTESAVILSLKDLVRQTVIVGPAITSGYGGYGSNRIDQSTKVYICDLSALQFQEPSNSGRLVLLRASPSLESGLLDELIYAKVVGEPRPSYEQATASENDARFVKFVSSVFGEVLFDTIAYKRFVAQDVVLAGVALNAAAESSNDRIHFKFLKYGSGFFAGDFGDVIEANILEGVLDGIEELFENHKPTRIESVELPFYERNFEERITDLEKQFKIPIMFSKDDALKETGTGVTGTTNCADPHAVMGNEMGYSSVDASIAENLSDKGFQFCPLINNNMTETFFPIVSTKSKM